MSKPSFESMVGREQAEAAEGYSKDYWDLVFEQLGKRRLFKVGMVVLALMYALAIYAPFIANDRPYRFEGVDIQEFNTSAKSLNPVVSSMARLMKFSEQEYEEQLRSAGTWGDAKAAPQTRAGALATEMEALDLRVDRILPSLPESEVEVRRDLQAMRASLVEATEAFIAGDESTAQEKVSQGKTMARSLRKSLRVVDPANPDGGGVNLVATAESPLWDDISPLEMFFMVFWALIMAWPLWNALINRALAGDREAIRNWRRRKVALVLGISFVSALAWFAVWGEGGNMDQNAKYKSGLTDGSLVAIQAGKSMLDADSEFDIPWAPIRFGTSETHTEEMFRPPTWKKSAKTDEEGRWVENKSMVESDLATQGGFKATYEKVIVRAGEPHANSPVRHLAGVDETGRDFLARMIWGGRTSLTVGILSAVLLTVIGVIFGSLAGYFGGWVDTAIMRLIEILQSIPAFYLILMTVAFIPSDSIKPIFAIVIVIALIRWTGTARLVRGEFMRLREQEFVVAAQALGFSNRRTIFRHVLPNAMSPVIVSAAFAVAA
ncbi:MAG: ABC transporter permease, partial [Planctomycetes bacterium]|nr:ABC transporter permease [Planctomycetota bacterium]